MDNIKRKVTRHESEINSQKQSSSYMSAKQKLEQ